ncbi:hypothetical protein ACFL6C_11285, partial [Myxococcota bacterium]
MNGEIMTELEAPVKEKLADYLRQQSVCRVASLTWIQELAQRLARWLCECLFEAWKDELMRLGKTIGLLCPKCGQTRRWKWRYENPMKIEVLGFCFELPKPYLECGHCDSKGLSIIKLLTGLSSGDASVQLKLMAAYSSAKETYGKSTQTLQAHHGQKVERTKVRRMALQIEEDAARYAETERQQVLGMLTSEKQGPGVLSLMLEADGDWKHTSDYVENASKVLCKLDVDAWCKKMKSSIWARNVSRRNALLAEAKAHRVKKLPAQYEKCPVHALTTYLQNNWKNMLFAERKKEGLPIVSARAESQVRDRTKGRFSVAGAWSEKNLEGK